MFLFRGVGLPVLSMIFLKMSTKRNLNLSLVCPCCSTINVPTLQNVGINLQGHNRKWWRNDRFKTLLKQPLVLEYFPCWNLSCMFTWIGLSVMAPDADGEQELLYFSFFPNPHTRERRQNVRKTWQESCSPVSLFS